MAPLPLRSPGATRGIIGVCFAGFTTAVTGITTPEAVRQAIKESVPAGSESLNLAAFEKGLDRGLGKLRAPRAA